MPVGPLIEVILSVDDMRKGVEFYRDRVGLKVLYPLCDNYAEEMWVVFDTGACRLCLHEGEKGVRVHAPKVVFGVEDIHAARSALVARGVALSHIRTPAPGVLVCDGIDPAGNPFSIESSLLA